MIRMMMTVDDAMRFCSSDVSKGQMYGSHWAYFWTRVETYRDNLTDEINVTKLIDDGSWDKRLAEIGVRKIPLRDFAKHLCPIGFTIIDSLGKHNATNLNTFISNTPYQKKKVAQPSLFDEVIA